MTAGSTIIRALEHTWAEAQDKHPDIPQVVFITGGGMHGLEVTWGHWHPDRWQEYGARSNRLPEVFISGECLAQGPSKVLETLLHEAAHGVAAVREIKEVSRGNRYHNQKFVRLAEELGLQGPEVAHTVRGWSDCTLLPETENSYESFSDLADAITVCMGGKLETGPEVGGDPNKEKRRTPKYGCGCGRVIRLGVKAYEMGPVLCGICDEPFLEVVA